MQCRAWQTGRESILSDFQESESFFYGFHPSSGIPDNAPMRLGSEQIQAIERTAQDGLGDDARVILFGSRTDDKRRGGDIDLLFKTPHRLDNRIAAAGRLYAGLIRQPADRKIDVLLKDAATAEAPVMRIARETGVIL